MKSVALSVCLLLLVLVLYPCVMGRYQPKRCCGPDQWEARIVNTGVTNRRQYYYNNLDIRFAFDKPNERWALDQKHPEDTNMDLKFVFDYKEGKRYAINQNGCFYEPLDVVLNPYCIGRNATYLGHWTIGLPNNPVELQAWSYDLFMYPLRHTLVLSKKTCMPIKEVNWSLIQNTWGWIEGEPACNPWEDPDVLLAGECYKSFKKHNREYYGTEPTGHVYNIDYVDTNLTITNEAIFEVPKDCRNETWVDNVQTSDFTRILIMRLKYYDEVMDDPFRETK